MALIAFDFDGTLSDSEMTVLLGERMDVAEEMADITERAMNDELSYADSLRRRAALLEGLSVERADEAYESVRLRPGAGDVIDQLREQGHTVVILTGGFDDGVEAALAAADTEVDRIVANHLPVSGGRLTGEVTGPLIEGTKDEQLLALTDELGIDPEATIAVGDGANDLPMLEVAGIAIGFSPKPAVEPVCDLTVSSMDDLAKSLIDHGVLTRS